MVLGWERTLTASVRIKLSFVKIIHELSFVSETHIISAIINVCQKVEEPWPLDIFDHKENHHKLYLKPGEMVLYESSRFLH